jgi:SAM-dependent methyltransferase
VQKLSKALAVILPLVFLGSGIASGAGVPDWGAPIDYAAATAGYQPEKKTVPDVPFEPTPDDVVERMVRIAGLKKTDVVYDLGCGDGRIVIAAVKQAGCRGVGIDIDGTLVKKSRENAARAGVADRTRFIEQDLFTADIREATVVMLFLWPEVNIRLRPILLNELKPGSRVVSHMHTMGEWKPDRMEAMGRREIMLWVIPANAGGTWTWKTASEGAHVLELEQRYQRIRGTLSRGQHKAPIAEAVLTGDRISFNVEGEVNGVWTTREYRGIVRGNTITGTVAEKREAKVRTSQWKAVRDPSTASSITHSVTQQPWP